jgi:uroporphyrinogen decarboxylase
MTTYERMRAVYEHREPDRVPMHDGPWGSTLERWYREGLPQGVGAGPFFGWDNLAGFGHDTSPRFPAETIEDTPEYTIHTTAWGATLKSWKAHGGVPEFLDFRIRDHDTWAEAKARMTPTEDRVNWQMLAEHYPRWQAEGAWITAGAWFGYDVLASWTAGYERVLMALLDDPDWCSDMIGHMLDMDLALLGMTWDRGYHFHCVRWPDDLGYRNGLLISPATYRRVIKPHMKRLVDWCHDRGVYTMLHSCGNVMDLVPDFVEIGLDSLNPLEQKAGMDVFRLKREFGDRLALEGGIDVRLMTDGPAIEEEIRGKFAVLKENGGYIYFSDHSVPENVSFADYCRVMDLVKWYGRY